MIELQRVTTEYSETEDRLRLAGEAGAEAGSTVVLWLTQRLLNRLVPHLCQWLEQQSGHVPLAEVRQEFAQQLARAELEPQAPVQAATPTREALLHSVDLRSTNAAMGLVFKDAAGNSVASLRLEAKPLRQWLNIVYDQYRKAQWPTTVWPAWVAEATPTPMPARAVLH